VSSPSGVCLRFLASLALLTVVATTSAESQRPEPALITQGAFIALSVSDVDASAKWYSEKLGLTIQKRIPRSNGVAGAILEGGGLIVEILQLDAAVPLSSLSPRPTSTTNVHGIFKAGMIVDDYDGALKRLRERGVQIAMGPFPASGDQRANVIIRDNSGNLIQLFAK
jgi:catechol 2,3-dioxygenase-like lactoylglutathione lyase family enzyme